MHWVSFLVGLLGAVDAGTSPSVSAPAPLLPRDALFARAERSDPKVSADGKRLAWLAADAKGLKQVWVRTLGTTNDAAVTQERRGVDRYVFAADSSGVLVTVDSDGDGNSHVLLVDFATKNARDLTPWQGVRAELFDPNPKVADTVLVAMNLRDRRVMDVHRINLKTGAAELDTQNPGDVQTWLVDPALVVRGAVATTPEGGTEVRIRDAAKAPWRTFISTGVDEYVQVYDFSLDNKSLLLATTISGDTARVVEKSLKTGSERVLAQNEKSDPVAVLLNSTKHVIQAVAFEVNGRTEWKSLDYTITADLETAKKAGAGDVSVVSVDTGETKWVLQVAQDVASPKYVLFDRKTRAFSNLFGESSRVDGVSSSLAPMTPVAFVAKDTTALTGLLTLPVGVDPKRLPLVVLVHDAPWERDRWGYRPEVQLLANRGYAVLQVNTRGSSGGGKRLLNAGNHQWGLAMNDDLVDAVKWAVDQGIADPKRVAIVGEGYGGFAAVTALGAGSDTWACGADAFGPLNLTTLLAALPTALVRASTNGEPPRAVWLKRVGNPADPADRDLLARASASGMVDKFRAPLLVAQGANDPRVKTTEVDQLLAALDKKNVPNGLVTYPDESSGFSRAENRVDFYARVDGFLAGCLGGRAEPLPKEGRVPGSTAVAKGLAAGNGARK